MTKALRHTLFAAIGGLAAWACKISKENHPLVKSERTAWAKDHSLSVDSEKKKAMLQRR